MRAHLALHDPLIEQPLREVRALTLRAALRALLRGAAGQLYRVLVVHEAPLATVAPQVVAQQNVRLLPLPARRL